MALTIPNTFSPNTSAVSADVNANFNAVATYINAGLATADIQNNAVTTAKIADGNVTGVKFASNVADGSTIELASNTLRLKDAGITLAKLAAAVAGALNPSGTVLAYSGTSAPSGYLLCDGSAVSRTTYADLFAVAGVKYGQGDGVNTFNVPDFRGRFLRGYDAAAGRDPDSASRTAMATGGSTGNNIGSIQDSQYTSHSHSFPAGMIGVGSVPAPAIAASGGAIGVPSSFQNNSMGASGGNETRPINAYVNYIVKT